MAMWASLADFQAACWPVAMRLYGYVGFACGRFAVVLVDLWRCHFPFPGVINATVRAAWPWVMGHTSSGPAAEWHWFPKSELGQAVRPWQSQWLSQWLRIWDYWWGENMYTHNYTYIHVYTLLLYIHTCRGFTGIYTHVYIYKQAVEHFFCSYDRKHYDHFFCHGSSRVCLLIEFRNGRAKRLVCLLWVGRRDAC